MIRQTLLRRAVGLLGGSRSFAVLTYHRVLASFDPLRPYEINHRDFRRQMQWIHDWFNVLTLSEAVQRAASNTLPPATVVITFDDGYRDNVEVALPILQDFNLKATFFIASFYLDGGIMWNDAVIEFVRRLSPGTVDLAAAQMGSQEVSGDASRYTLAGNLINALKYRPFDERQAIVDELLAAAASTMPRDLMMRSDDVRELSRAGMEVGGHTRRHPILARLPAEQAREEIEGGKRDLEAIIGRPIEAFAYPNGRRESDYLPEHVAMAERAGFRAAVTTENGIAGLMTDRFQIPRLSPWDTRCWRFSLRLLSQLATASRAQRLRPSTVGVPRAKL